MHAHNCARWPNECRPSSRPLNRDYRRNPTPMLPRYSECARRDGSTAKAKMSRYDTPKQPNEAEAEAMQRSISEQNAERHLEQRAMGELSKMQQTQFNSMVQQSKQHEARDQ